MKRSVIWIVSTIVCIAVAGIISCTVTKEPSEEQFSFILAADWRYTASEGYHSTDYFLGALEKIKAVGPGTFMISPGDVEPVKASAKLISSVLGEDYPWYPVIGNHELDDMKYVETLRNLNDGGKTLPNIVRSGPPGCEETTYSFDYGDCHFVVLNQYYDGSSDTGTDGDIVPELLSWLENDLRKTTKKYIFVVGHEPLVSVPDMGNGRHRHVGDSLDKYPVNAFKFYQLLRKYKVVAYLHGHTHSTSFSQINGLWQIDCGHARGTEDVYPGRLYNRIRDIYSGGKEDGMTLDDAINRYFPGNEYSTKKVLYYMEMTDGISYKKLNDDPARKILKEFYLKAESLGENKDGFFRTYFDNWRVTQSTFMKLRIHAESVFVDIYRNDAHGGPYTLVETLKIPVQDS